PTGSDAVEAAIKLAKYNNHRLPVIAFEGSYHGMTAGALSLSSGRSFKEGLLPLVPEVHYIPYAYCYRCAFGQKRESCSLACAQYLEHVLDDPHSGINKPAALIIEAIQGEGGTVVPPPQFLPRIREICHRHDILMIIDEVQAGLGRTGKMFAFEHTSTIPDMVTISKGLGGIGFPIACLAFKKELDRWPPGKHIGTFRGNVLAYEAGQAALRFMLKNRLAEYAFNLGQTMLSWLKEVEKDSEIIGEVRGQGLMIGVELVQDRASRQPATDLAQKIRSFCHSRGLLVEIGGHYANVIRFLPPLVLPEELAIKGIEIFEDAVRKVEKSR
ncbi:MAG: aspartate aminotransferase family protein, partial [Candidatus Aminicenantales bacterium]